MADLCVLCYHAVSDTWPADLAVTQSRLEQQVDFLLRRGFHPAVFHEAVTAPPRPKTFAITFDDGFRSVATLAFPLLAARGVPASVFFATDFVGRPGPMSWAGIDAWADGPHRAELEPLTVADIRMLAEAGWELGSHTCSHPHLTTLGDSALAHELEGSRQRCEEITAQPCRSLAYPYGDSDERVMRAAERAGYDVACLLPSRFAPPQRLAWPRVGVYRQDGTFTFRTKVSPLVRRIRAWPMWPVLNGVRKWPARSSVSGLPTRPS